MAYTQGHVGRGNFAQIVYAKRMALQGTGGKKKKKKERKKKKIVRYVC